MKVARMPLEEFEKNLMIIKNDNDFYNSLYSLARKYDRDDSISIFPKSICVAIEALEYAIGDKYENVSWWCFEKDWGKNKDLHIYDKNNNIIPSETPEDIYNIVISNIENSKNGE